MAAILEILNLKAKVEANPFLSVPAELPLA